MVKLNKKVIGCLFIAVLMIASILLVLQVAGIFNFWQGVILNFFFVIFLGFGIIGILVGFVQKKTFSLFIGSILFSVGLFYALFNLFSIWWIALILCLVFIAIIAIISYICFGNKSDYADNQTNDDKSK